MRRTTALLTATLLMVAAMAIPALADEPPPGPPFHIPHTHVLLIGADVADVADPDTGAPYTIEGFDKCVDLAGGQALRHNRFHENIHFGKAGVALRGAGQIVVPFASCAMFD